MKCVMLTVPRCIVLAFAAALLVAAGCSNSSSGSGTPIFACGNGGLAPAATVVMTCGSGNSVDTQSITVVMGGPLSGTATMRGLNFDVVYNPALLKFSPASTFVSTLFPSPPALISVALANDTEGRLIVSMQQPAGSPDVTVDPGQHNVLSLTFKRVGTATFGSTPITFENAEATGSSASLTFTNGIVLGYQ